MPRGLPATTAPCPHCGKEVTSPGPGGNEGAAGEPLGEQPDDQLSGEEVVRLEVREEEQHGTQDPADQTESAMGSTEEGQGIKRMVVGLISFLCVAAGIALWIALQGGGQSSSDATGGREEVITPEQAEEAWRTTGWKADASKVLAAFMSAKSAAERIKYVIPNEGVREELETFYPQGRDDSDTPIELFAHRTGNENDHKRGIFLMQYRQPSQTDIRNYFVPIRSLDKALGVKGATLIDMAHQINEDHLSRPIGINAFFKKTEQGLKLDASVFIQSKYRTFRAFADYPRPGKKQLFRVVIEESVDHDLRDDGRYRTYRLDDFAYPQDYVMVSVLADSEVGKILSVLNWRGTNRPMSQQSATVELGWSKETPASLQIERVVCWEFLGVGGEAGNTKPSQEAPSPPVSPAPAVPANQDGE